MYFGEVNPKQLGGGSQGGQGSPQPIAMRKELIDAGVGLHQGDRAPGPPCFWGGSVTLQSRVVSFLLSFTHLLALSPEASLPPLP